jgi:hypothetical protein
MRNQLIVLTLAIMTAATGEAGVVIQITAKDSSGKQSDTRTMYAQDGALRDDHLDERSHVTSFSLIRDGVVWEVDVPKRTYSKVDKAAMKARLEEGQQRMKEMAATLPPERRALFEQRMQQAQSAHHDYAWTDTGRTEHVGQYSCRVWEGKRDDKVQRQDCVVPFGSLPGGDELAAALRQAAATAMDIASANPAMAKASSEMFSGFQKFNGWPVLTRHISGGKTYREEVAKSIDRQPLPADKFEIPKGFTEKSFVKDHADE